MTSRALDPARRRRWPALLAAVMMLTAGCTSVLDRPSLSPAGTGDPRTVALGVTTTSASITPVTPDGLVTGPGVTDGEITLAVLADPSRDRGFTGGVQLWQRSVNTAGGLCGRAVTLAANGSDGIPAQPAAAYRSIGTTVLGLLAPFPPTDATLSTTVVADQIPTVTATATSAQLGPAGPMVAGATADIMVINGLQHLLTTGKLEPGDTVGVLDDGSGTAGNALAGARWWAARNQFVLDVRDAGTDPSGWAGNTVILAPAAGPAVSALVTGTSADVSVLTLLDGFDPGSWGADAVRAAADRLYVATPAPAYGSDYPAAVAVASMAAAAGTGHPGARTLDGYAAGSAWSRLIGRACSERALTRQGIWQAATAVGPAPATSLFGAGDPGLVLRSGLPATRMSSISVADAAAPTGLRSLAWLESAPDIEDYIP